MCSDVPLGHWLMWFPGRHIALDISQGCREMPYFWAWNFGEDAWWSDIVTNNWYSAVVRVKRASIRKERVAVPGTEWCRSEQHGLRKQTLGSVPQLPSSWRWDPGQSLRLSVTWFPHLRTEDSHPEPSSRSAAGIQQGAKHRARGEGSGTR